MAGQIVARGKNTWLVRVPLGREPDTGKRKYHNKTVHGTKKDAERYLTQVLRERDTGTFMEPSRESLNTYLDRWLEVSAKRRVRPRTHDDYKTMLRVHIRPALGARELSKITTMEIQQVVADMEERGLSSRTIRYAHSVLKSALGQAVTWRVIQQNPAEHVYLPRMVRKEMEVLSKEQADQFLEAAKGDRWNALWTLLISSGLRPGEALGLKWTDLDGDKVRVQRMLVSNHRGGWYFDEPKTDRSRRVVPLPGGTMRVLQQHRARQAEDKLKAGPDYEDNGLIFAGANGRPLDYHNLVRRHFKRVLKAAELPGIRLYDLRHTHATLLLASGVHPKIVSERLGHSSITLTLDTYSHVLPDMQQEAAEKLELLLFARATS